MVESRNTMNDCVVVGADAGATGGSSRLRDEAVHGLLTERVDRFHNEHLDPFFHNFNCSILDPRSEIPQDWFKQPLSQQLMNGMSDRPPAGRAAENQDPNGNFRYSIDMQRGQREFHAEVSEGRQYDWARIRLLFVDLQFKQGRDFDETVKDIAKELHTQSDLNRVRELAEKIDDPRTRRGLMLAVLEKELKSHGESYLNIAYDAVQKMDLSSESPEQQKARTDAILRRIRESRNAPDATHQTTETTRPGLSESEQRELITLCQSNWTRDELLWNVARAKHDWTY